MLVEFSLVTHASVSPHMHVVLHNSSFCSWLTPSFVRVCSSVLFSPVPPPRSYSCSGKEMCVTPSTTSWSPAGWEEEKIRERGWMRGGGEGRNVTLWRLWPALRGSYGSQTWPIKWSAVSSKQKSCRYCYMNEQMDADKTAGEKAWRQLHKNAAWKIP